MRVARALILLLLALPASAHLIVDVGLSVDAPQYAAAGSAITYAFHLTNLAYDSAFGVVLTDQLPNGMKFVSAKGTDWNCSESKGTVTCSAELLKSGVSTVTVVANSPTSAGPIHNDANVLSIGSVDPYSPNDTISADTLVYSAAACAGRETSSLVAPSEASELASGSVQFTWSPAAGADKYRVWSSVEGAKPTLIAETPATALSADLEFGWNEWWVEATFASCPPTESAHHHVFSNGKPFRLYLSDFAGTAGAPGIDDGSVTDAKFDAPTSLGIDIYGVGYILDTTVSLVRRVTGDKVDTIAGDRGTPGWSDGAALFAKMNHPLAIAVTGGGYVFVADTENDVIRQLYPKGDGIVFTPVIFTIAGGPGVMGALDGPGHNARFDHPSGIAVAPDYTVFIADTGNGRIRRYAHDTGEVTTVARDLGAPMGLALDASGNLFIADAGTNTIRVLAADGTLRTLAGATAQFNAPSAVALDALGNVYVADTGNHAIRRIAPSGLVTTVLGDGTPGHANGAVGRLDTPTGIAIDGAGRLWIADRGNHVIRMATTVAPPEAGPRRRSVGR